MANPDSDLPVGASDLRFLSADQIQMIDEALESLRGNGFGCLRLVIEKGVLRFMVKETSYDALKYKPGRLAGE